jgi:hypothetical protein
MFRLIATMTIIASASCFIGEQNGCQNWFRKDYRANRKTSRRQHCVSRGGMVDELEGIGNIDGVHDEGARYRGPSPALRLDAFVAEDVYLARDLSASYLT